MTDDVRQVIEAQRNMVADALIASIFAARPIPPLATLEQGQGWCLDVATTMLARAILGVIGPGCDPAEMLEMVNAQVRERIQSVQSQQFRRTIMGNA